MRFCGYDVADATAVRYLGKPEMGRRRSRLGEDSR